MDISRFFINEGENPLDNIVSDGGFCSIFRTIACVGDSLSSGEFESLNENGEKGYHDYFEYSWGQFLARETGSKVYNFSRGGMTAREYCESFAESKDFWNPELKAQAYIIALGVNDLCNRKKPIGSIDDIDLNDYNNNKDTFAGNYGKIIQRYKEIQPKAKFFLVGFPKGRDQTIIAEHTKLLKELANLFDYTYVLDLCKYGTDYDSPEFRKAFFLGGHMNPMGYKFMAKVIMSYIDYIIRANPEDFAQVGFIGTDFFNCSAKW